MTEYRRCNVIVVIHHRDDRTTLAQSDIAVQAGCWGAAVIGDGTLAADMAALTAARSAHVQFSEAGFNIGFNARSMKPADAFLCSRNAGLDFTWIDEAGIKAEEVSREVSNLIQVAGYGRNGDHLVFVDAGFPIYGHGDGDDPGGVVRAVNNLGWIPTISGLKTGVPPSVQYLQAMCEAMESPDNPDGHGLAVASAITPDSASQMVPFVDWLLVAADAADANKEFHEIEPVLLCALVDVARTERHACMLRSLGFPEGAIAEAVALMRRRARRGL